MSWRVLEDAEFVVFDLDGTLADTADLTDGRRVPADVLVLDPLAADSRPWALGSMPLLPGRVRASGRGVFIMTRSPAAYASTLLGLIGVDPLPLLPSAGPHRVEFLAALARDGKVAFVGDQAEDAAVADRAGVAFVHVDDLRADVTSDLEPHQTSRPDSQSVADIVWALRNGSIGAREELQLRLSQAVTADHRSCLLLPAQSYPHGELEVLLPLGLAPGLFTREEATQRPEVYRAILRTLLPLNSRTVEGLDHHWLVPFNTVWNWKDPLGREIAHLKDYEKPRGSGPHPKLWSLRVIADAVGAHAAQLDVSSLEPMPASARTPQKPGEVSLWLATWAAGLAELPVVRPVNAATWSSPPTGLVPRVPTVDSLGPLLVDDQYTEGNALRKRGALRAEGVSGLLTWTASRVPARQHPPLRDNLRGCRWPGSEDCPVHQRGVHWSRQDAIPRSPTKSQPTPRPAGRPTLIPAEPPPRGVTVRGLGAPRTPTGPIPITLAATDGPFGATVLAGADEDGLTPVAVRGADGVVMRVRLPLVWGDPRLHPLDLQRRKELRWPWPHPLTVQAVGTASDGQILVRQYPDWKVLRDRARVNAKRIGGHVAGRIVDVTREQGVVVNGRRYLPWKWPICIVDLGLEDAVCGNVPPEHQVLGFEAHFTLAQRFPDEDLPEVRWQP